jgi:uncharacterized protein (DUF608 family)
MEYNKSYSGNREWKDSINTENGQWIGVIILTDMWRKHTFVILWDFIVNTHVFLAQIGEIYQTSESFGRSIVRSSVVRRIENIENTYSKVAAINRWKSGRQWVGEKILELGNEREREREREREKGWV